MAPRDILYLLAFAPLFVFHVPAYAQWIPDGTPLCTEVGDQRVYTIVPDGSGGAIVVWSWEAAASSGYADSLIAHHITASGEIASGWPTCGVPLSSPSSMVSDVFGAPVGVSDDEGGAIVAWGAHLNNRDRIHVQRVTGSGEIATGWPADGVDPYPAHQSNSPDIASDGGNGAIVTWGPARVQRITAAGVLAWSDEGVPATTTLAANPRIISDGSGGAIVAWADYRDGAENGADIYAQRLDHDGTLLWAPDGIPVAVGPGQQGAPNPLVMVPDDSGGAIIAWPQCDSSLDIQAQRITSSGSVSPGWPPSGVSLNVPDVSPCSFGQILSVVSDGAGGAMVVWTDWRAGTGQDDIYAQHVLGTGVLAPGWPSDGLGICTAARSQNNHRSVSDGTGGVIIAWADDRQGSSGNPQYDIYAQRVLPSGGVAPPWWPGNGRAICTATGVQGLLEIVSDGAGGAIIAWSDWRDEFTTGIDVYAQRVTTDGLTVDVPYPEVQVSHTLRLQAGCPNPFRHEVILTYQAPAGMKLTVEILDLSGRRVRRLVSNRISQGGRETLTWDALSDEGETVPDGVYFVRVHGGAESATQKLVVLQ